MANIQCIAEHSVDLDLLTGGIVIDAGCLGFEFSEAMVNMGCQVYAFDIQEMIPPVCVTFIRKAVSRFNGSVNYRVCEDKQATHLNADGKDVVQVIDIYQTIQRIAIDGFVYNKEIEVLKLDIEGSEYLLLCDQRLKGDTWQLPRQITVEFHEHAHKAMHDAYFDAAMENLSHNYTAIQHERTSQHGAGFNYWDSLFIRKDLI